MVTCSLRSATAAAAAWFAAPPDPEAWAVGVDLPALALAVGALPIAAMDMATNTS